MFSVVVLYDGTLDRILEELIFPNVPPFIAQNHKSRKIVFGLLFKVKKYIQKD